jgi:hypothetical protein
MVEVAYTGVLILGTAVAAGFAFFAAAKLIKADG